MAAVSKVYFAEFSVSQPEAAAASPLLMFLSGRIKEIEGESHITDAFVQRVTMAPVVGSKPYTGLRHVYMSERQDGEASRGIQRGDSINLSFMEVKELKGYERILTEHGAARFTGSPLELSEGGRKTIYVEYEKSLNAFLFRSYCYDMPDEDSKIELGVTTLRKVWELLQHTRFSFVQYSADLQPYDYSNYWGLGKFGSRGIAAEQITPLPPVTLEELGIAEEQLDMVINTDPEHNALFALLLAHQRHHIFQFQGPLSGDKF